MDCVCFFYVVGDYFLVECFNRIGLSLCVYICFVLY